MSRFNTIKKSRKRSHEIEEKLNVLNRELEKTKDIHEIAPTMSTSGIYVGSENQANQDHSDFESKSHGGEGLGFSGADGNTAGNASIGDSSGVSGVALSPPHPVTGVRNSAVHYRTGTGDTTPLRPGVTITRGFSDNPPSYTMGSCLWFYDSDFNNGIGQPAGKWCNLEFSNFDGDTNGQWFFWDTNDSGFFVVNTDLSQHPCGDISGLISGLNFPGDGGAIGSAFNTVITQQSLDDPGSLPIDIDDLSKQAFDSLRERAQRSKGKPTSPEDPKTTETKKQGEGKEDPRIAELLNDAKRIDANNQRLADELTAKDPRNLSAALFTITIGGTYFVAKSLYAILLAAIAAGYSYNQLQQLQSDFEADLSSTIIWRSTLSDAEWEKKTEEARQKDVQAANEANERLKNAEKELKDAKESGNEDRIQRAREAYENALRNKERVNTNNANNNAARRKARRERYGNKDNPKGTFFNSYKPQGDVLSESIGLGQFEPNILDVDVKNIRKNIKPEFPKDPPPEMIDGYSAKSRLAPKKNERKPFIKIAKKDLAQNHKLTDKEIKDFMNDINMINDYIKKNPADLIYVQQRYPKHDPRLAQLNWQMDQMLDASKKYIDRQFPENQNLFNKLKNKIKNTIDQTDPKNFKPVKDPIKYVDVKKTKKLKETVTRHFNKPVKSKSMFGLNMGKVRKTNQKMIEKREQEQRIQEEEKAYIQERMSRQKSNWKDDLTTL